VGESFGVSVELAGEIAFFAVLAELLLKRGDDFPFGEPGVFCSTAAIKSQPFDLAALVGGAHFIEVLSCGFLSAYA
jgi:hypothetical protein